MTSLLSILLQQRQNQLQQAFNATRAYEWNERLRNRRNHGTREQISNAYIGINQAFSSFSDRLIDYRENQLTVIGSEERGGSWPRPFARGRWQTRTVIGVDVEHGDGFNIVGRIQVPIRRYTIHGTDGDDRITMTGNTNDTIHCHGGDDFVSSGNGDDAIMGGDGFETINAGGGNNYVHAGYGGGVIQSENGNDHVIVSHGDHTIDAGSGNNRIQAFGVTQRPIINDPDCGEEGFFFDEFPCAPDNVVYISTNTIRTPKNHTENCTP